MASPQPLQPEPGITFVFRSTRDKPMTETITLSACLDSQAAQELATVLDQHRRLSLTLSAEQVSFLGALTLQVLISAFRQWREDGNEFHIVNPSAAFLEGVELLGADPAAIGLGKPLEVLQ